MKLTNRTMLVTGGTSGMGLELAKQFLEPDSHNTQLPTPLALERHR